MYRDSSNSQSIYTSVFNQSILVGNSTADLLIRRRMPYITKRSPGFEFEEIVVSFDGQKNGKIATYIIEEDIFRVLYFRSRPACI